MRGKVVLVSPPCAHLMTCFSLKQVLLPAQVCFGRHRDELGYPFGGLPRSPAFIPREEAGFLVVGSWAQSNNVLIINTVNGRVRWARPGR